MSAPFVPTLERPPLQQAIVDSPIPIPHPAWRVLVVCQLLNRTGRAQVEPMVWRLLDLAPTPAAMFTMLTGPAGPIVLEPLLEPLGLLRRRVEMLRDLALAWTWRAPEIMAGKAPVESLPGCGAYARDAFDVFVRGRLDVEPADEVLAAWVGPAPARGPLVVDGRVWI